MDRENLRDFFQRRGPTLPFSSPTLLAVVYLTIYQVFMTLLLFLMAVGLFERAHWPEIQPVCATLTVVNYCWIAILVVDGGIPHREKSLPLEQSCRHLPRFVCV